MALISVIILLLICGLVAFFVYKKMKKYEDEMAEKQVKQIEDAFLAGKRSVSREEFMNLLMYRRDTSDIGGVYMIQNLTRDLYFIEGSHHMLDDLNKQFYGFYNQDVHTDFANEAKMEITLFPLSQSKFDTLEALEENIRSFYNVTPDKDYKTDWSERTEKPKSKLRDEFKSEFYWEKGIQAK